MPQVRTRRVGWLAVGFGSAMLGSVAVIGLPGEATPIQLSRLDGYSVFQV